MELIRRNTDYALRFMVSLGALENDETKSARVLSHECDVPYQLSCKLLQKLGKAKLVVSSMGNRGGFALSKPASEIDLLSVIEAIQGEIAFNSCLLSKKGCPRINSCPITSKLHVLQNQVTSSLASITIADLVTSTNQ